MEISEDLKNNLIADVENICCIDLKDETIELLKRCFEITIGTHNLKIEQPSSPVSGNIKPDLNYFRTNILRHLSTEEMIILRNWLNGYEQSQSKPVKPEPGKSAYKNSQEYILNEWGKEWLNHDWQAGDVVDALAEYRNQPSVQDTESPLTDEAIYDIDCAGNAMIQISIRDNIPSILQSINGYGERINTDKIIVTKAYRDKQIKGK